MGSDKLYTVVEVRKLLGARQEDIASKLGVSKAHYCKLENSKRAWTLRLANKWLEYVLDELDKLPEGVVDFSKVMDFGDLDKLNDSLPEDWQWQGRN